MFSEYKMSKESRTPSEINCGKIHSSNKKKKYVADDVMVLDCIYSAVTFYVHNILMRVH